MTYGINISQFSNEFCRHVPPPRPVHNGAALFTRALVFSMAKHLKSLWLSMYSIQSVAQFIAHVFYCVQMCTVQWLIKVQNILPCWIIMNNISFVWCSIIINNTKLLTKWLCTSGTKFMLITSTCMSDNCNIK